MPAIDRPSGVPLPHACSANRLCATSSGSSSCMAISSRMTSRSASTSSPVSSELVIMSPSTSIASGRSLSSTRAWKQVYSLAVNALNSPPTASRAIEMSSADRSPVPLKSRCSRKCEQPCSVAVSSREPTPTQTPMLAERTPASCSVTIRRPLGRTVRRTSEVTRPPPSRTDCRVRVETRFSVRPRLSSASASAGASASSTTGTSDSLPRSSISPISTWIFWPTETTSSTASTRLPPASGRSLLMCSRPSLPGISETNAPKLVVLTTVPR